MHVFTIKTSPFNAGGRHGFVTCLLDYNSETDESGEKIDNSYFANNDQALFPLLSEECGGGGVDSLTE